MEDTKCASVLSESHLFGGVAKAVYCDTLGHWFNPVRCPAGQESFLKSKIVQQWDSGQKCGASCCSAGRDIADCLLFYTMPTFKHVPLSQCQMEAK